MKEFDEIFNSMEFFPLGTSLPVFLDGAVETCEVLYLDYCSYLVAKGSVPLPPAGWLNHMVIERRAVPGFTIEGVPAFGGLKLRTVH